MEWDGTSWTEVADVPVAPVNWAGCGTQVAALAFQGTIPSPKEITLEWTKPQNVEVITD